MLHLQDYLDAIASKSQGKQGKIGISYMLTFMPLMVSVMDTQLTAYVQLCLL